MKKRDQHLFDPGPKRILALDGGGIRGVLTLAILSKIESLLSKRAGDESSFVLADYFDLIGGTSTGAIIAAALAMGWRVDRIATLYRELGNTIFDSRWYRKGVLRPKFPVEPLREALLREFEDTCMGDESVHTGLAIVAKRLDTGSPWVIHNNPRGPYFDRRPGGKGVANNELLVREVVRASTAAPHYFEPEEVVVARDDVGGDIAGAFVDGGVSPHNNPSLQLLMLATLEGHGFRWRLGADRLLLASLGTGSKETKLETGKVMRMTAAELAGRSLLSMMDDASALNEQILQWLSRSPTARAIDREVGDLRNDVLGGGAPWLTYVRYDARLDAKWLRDHLDLHIDPKQLESIYAMDEPENMDALSEIGRAVAERLVEPRHFDACLDPDW